MNKENQNVKATSINIVEGIHSALIRRLLSIRKHRPVFVTHEDTNEEKLISMTSGSNETLLEVTSVFPFTLFPSTISLNRQKVTIINRTFFRTANTISMQIEDIFNVDSEVGFFFGSIHLYSKYFVNDAKTINHIWRKDVLKIQRLLQGYLIAQRKEIDCSDIEKDRLVDLLNGLGKAMSK